MENSKKFKPFEFDNDINLSIRVKNVLMKDKEFLTKIYNEVSNSNISDITFHELLSALQKLKSERAYSLKLLDIPSQSTL